ncbi:hypothetical protein AB6A40_011564 [Gnathostoma spinigerum]|uniref:Uncharacterized protein n=1 Tax=Gnathostoma spinigerum TaxID=75299 RepID=A0ABD6F4T6_9BILA
MFARTQWAGPSVPPDQLFTPFPFSDPIGVSRARSLVSPVVFVLRRFRLPPPNPPRPTLPREEFLHWVDR